MPLDLTLFDKLQALPRMQCHWRTRKMQEGWVAQCKAGADPDRLITWQARGDTEQEALDRAVDHALEYWSWSLRPRTG